MIPNPAVPSIGDGRLFPFHSRHCPNRPNPLSLPNARFPVPAGLAHVQRHFRALDLHLVNIKAKGPVAARSVPRILGHLRDNTLAPHPGCPPVNPTGLVRSEISFSKPS